MVLILLFVDGGFIRITLLLKLLSSLVLILLFVDGGFILICCVYLSLLFNGVVLILLFVDGGFIPVAILIYKQLIFNTKMSNNY